MTDLSTTQLDLIQVVGVMRVTENLEEITVFERTSDKFLMQNPLVTVKKGKVNKLDTKSRTIYLEGNEIIQYNKLCLATGSHPKIILDHPNVIGIRDLQSVTELAEFLRKYARVLIVGNGGIALELVHELDYCDITWLIRDDYIGNTFFDATSSAFVLPSLASRIRRNSTRNNSNNNDNDSKSNNKNENGNNQRYFYRKKEVSVEIGLSVRNADINLDNNLHGIINNSVNISSSCNIEMKERLAYENVTEQRVCSSSSNNSSSSSAVGNQTSISAPVPSSYDHHHTGAALGPDWLVRSDLRREVMDTSLPLGVAATSSVSTQRNGSLEVCYQQELRAIYDLSQSPESLPYNKNNYDAVNDIHNNLRVNITARHKRWTLSNDQSNATVYSPEEIEICSMVLEDSLIATKNYKLLVLTSSLTIYGCDFIVSATGVAPDTNFLGPDFVSEIQTKDSGEILVDGSMRTSVPYVCAAGDCCWIEWKLEGREENIDGSSNNKDIQSNSHWFQMKLWNQARHMGIIAANTLCSDECRISFLPDICPFLLFTHITHFFDFKVILLGRFNGQGLPLNQFQQALVKQYVATTDISSVTNGYTKEKNDSKIIDKKIDSVIEHTPLVDEKEMQVVNSETVSDIEVWYRVTPGKEYVKVVLHRQRVVGAMLIGDTGLEEVFENLILNGLDVSRYGIELLNPLVDLEDYFD